MHVVQNMQSVIYNHAYNVFRNKALPPSCVDTKAIFQAQEIVCEYTFKGILSDMVMRITRGAV